MLTFDTDNLTLLPFNGWPHLQNHLSYLFRTDSKQKWTNCRTKKNLIIIGESVHTIGRNMEERKAMAKVARSLIREQKAYYTHLYMCCIECLDESAYSYDAALIDEVLEVMQEMDVELGKDGMWILFAVTHEDQENLHFHLVIYKSA